MSTNTPAPPSTKNLRTFTGCLNHQLKSAEYEALADFLNSELGWSVNAKDLKDLAFPEEISEYWIRAVELGILSKVRDFISKNLQAPGDSPNLLQNEITLALLDKDIPAAKSLIKKYCLRYKSAPQNVIQKIFQRHLSFKLLKVLPENYSLLLARSHFYENFFDPETELVQDWLIDCNSVKDEKSFSEFCITGKIKNLEQKIPRALSCWQQRSYKEVAENLSFLTVMIERNKVTAARICPYLIAIHVYSLFHTGNKSSTQKTLQLYKNLAGDSLYVRMLEIFLDISDNNFKRAGKKLDTLQFFHKNYHSDTFFLLVSRYWCQGELSGSDIEKVRRLLNAYSQSGNKLMEYETRALYKYSIGATDLGKENSIFTHKPFAGFLKNEKSIFDLLEEQLSENQLEKRFIWLLQIEPGSVNREGWVDIEPALQERGKSGTWKKPEMLPWKEVLKSEVKQLLSSVDRRVVSLLKDTGKDSKLDYDLPQNRAVGLLCGAENLFLEDDFTQKIIFEQTAPVIEYSESGSSKSIQWKYPATPGALHVEEVDDFVYEICALDEKLAKLKSKTTNPVTLNNSSDDLKTFFSTLPENLLIEGDELFTEGVGSTLETIIIARLTPAGDSIYRVKLLTGCGDLTSIPGEGRRVISLKRGSSQFVWERDKQKELSTVVNICSEAKLDLEECISPYEWEMSSTEKLLPTLEYFHKTKAITLQWPRGGRLKVKSSTGGNISVKASGKKDWFKIEGEVIFDKQSMKLSEVLKSLKGNSRFIEVSKNEFLSLSKELAEGLQSISSVADQRDECLQLHAALADTLSTRLGALPVDVEEEFIFRECVTQMVYSKSIQVKIPDGLNAELRPYQRKGYEWLYRMVKSNVGVCLADDMGLGKTLQTLALLLELKSDGPSLIIAPTSLCYNWISESEKFSPSLKLLDYRGTERSDLLDKVSEGTVVVSSYGIVMQDIDLLQEINWNVVALDEAQLVKNAGTLRSKAIKLIQAKGRIALSGTPVENHVGELWNLFDWLNPGFLGTRSYFQNHYALPIEKRIPGKLESLKEKVQPFILRRLKKNVLQELPASQESVIYVEMSSQEQEIYNANKYLVAKNLNKSKKEKRRSKNKIQILAEITRLRKITSNFELSEVFDGKSSKTEAILAKVEELLENDHNALLFSQFTTHLDVLEDYFKERNFPYCRLDGTMSPSVRETEINKFTSGEKPLMLISLKAGGFGLNLTAADFVLHLDPWWNPAVEEQASARAIRIGQDKKVTVLKFITSSSIEEEIIKLHSHKKDITEDILKGTSKASQLSIEDLLKLIK